MKQLLIAIIILIPVLCCAQNQDIEKAARIMNDQYRRNSKSNNTNSQRGSNSSYSSTGATTKPGVITKKVNVRTSGQRKELFNGGMDDYAKAKEVTYMVGGKTPAQHAMLLMNGDTPADVSINYLKSTMVKLPVTQRYQITKKIKEEAGVIKNIHYNDYNIQFRKAESKIKSKDASVTEKQVGEYVKLRMNGKNLNNTYFKDKDIIAEVDNAADKYKKVQTDSQRISRLQSYLDEIKAECGGKCE